MSNSLAFFVSPLIQIVRAEMKMAFGHQKAERAVSRLRFVLERAALGQPGYMQ